MADEEIRDELLTALVAGHETTASSLAFAFEQLARAPQAQERLASGDDDYLEATINEVMRRRPVLPNPEPRLVKQPVEIGGWTYPAGTVLIASALLIHHDPAIYPEPYAFRPERFLDTKPGTYTWLPFGGGRRRCLGASFALRRDARCAARGRGAVLRRTRRAAPPAQAAADHADAERPRNGRPDPPGRRAGAAAPGRRRRRLTYGFMLHVDRGVPSCRCPSRPLSV